MFREINSFHREKWYRAVLSEDPSSEPGQEDDLGQVERAPESQFGQPEGAGEIPEDLKSSQNQAQEIHAQSLANDQSQPAGDDNTLSSDMRISPRQSRPRTYGGGAQKGWTERRLEGLKQRIVERKMQRAAARTAGKVATRGAAAVASHGTALALGAVGGPAGWAADAALLAIDAGLILINALKNPLVQKILFGLNITAIFIGIFFIVNAASIFSSSHHNGADPLGATAPRPATDSYAPAVASQDGGIIVADSLATIGPAIQAIEALLARPPQGANTGEAARILSELKKIQEEMKVNAFASNPQAEAKVLGQYKQLVFDLYGALYPGRKAAQAQVLALQSRISYQSGVCAPGKDVKGLALSENAFRVIAAAASSQPITVNCLVTGHRKYVGKPPSQGFPRCGDPRVVAGGRASLHCLGRAVDFDESASLFQFLQANRAQLNIRQVIDEGNHIHVEVLP